jgi:hypothetical protein
MLWGLEPCHELFNGTKGQRIACDIPIETPFTNYVQNLNNLQPKGGARIFLLVVTLFIRIIVHDMEENPAKLCKIHVLVASSTNQPIQVCILKPDSGLEKG